MTSPQLEQIESNQYRLSGPIDFQAVPSLYEQGIKQFAKQNQSSIQIDLGGISSSNSAALALFLAWIRHAKRYNQTINYANMPLGLERVAQLYDIKHLLL